jgi:hypothetical protein
MYRITCRSVVSSSLKCQIIRWSQHENGVHGEYVMRTWISPNRVKSNCVDSSNIHNVGQSNLCYLLLTRVELEVKEVSSRRDDGYCILLACFNFDP